MADLPQMKYTTFNLNSEGISNLMNFSENEQIRVVSEQVIPVTDYITKQVIPVLLVKYITLDVAQATPISSDKDVV